MNKNVMKMLVAGLTCVALCGTTLAAPTRTSELHPTPHPSEHLPDDHHEAQDWVALGAAVIVGVVGGIVGACKDAPAELRCNHH